MRAVQIDHAVAFVRGVGALPGDPDREHLALIHGDVAGRLIGAFVQRLRPRFLMGLAAFPCPAGPCRRPRDALTAFVQRLDVDVMVELIFFGRQMMNADGAPVGLAGRNVGRLNAYAVFGVGVVERRACLLEMVKKPGVVLFHHVILLCINCSAPASWLAIMICWPENSPVPQSADCGATEASRRLAHQFHPRLCADLLAPWADTDSPGCISEWGRVGRWKSLQPLHSSPWRLWQ